MDKKTRCQAIDSLLNQSNRLSMTDGEKETLERLCVQGAKAGDAEAILALGRLYYEGFTVSQDYTTARHYFEQAADLGSEWALNYLGYCYYYGRAIPVDYEKAFYYFSKSGAKGNHCALYKLGDMYRDGLYVAADQEKALSYYRQAIDRITPERAEYPNICFRIGHCVLMAGDDGAAALDALKWLHQAQEGCFYLLSQGDPYAHLSLPEIEKDIRRALSLLQRWIPKDPAVQYT
ncbi:MULTISPECIES: tetratricopeptide repeat protein [Eubacterium]|uniref:Sel1 repeat-containing protein n=1 Tax=Eubacterium barkeri TaxID=1528 RepID=A0A1H3G521_EUBBA|nr:tetratricopeptide repeat protein [Eubacterium barkeri]SDX97788.1 hypothetical protein SAMN04488579_11282 [Eubacterium barkeri]